MKKIFSFQNLFWGVWIAIGVGYFVNGVMTLRNARQSNGWPSAKGEITNSSIRTESTDDGLTYHADVEYRFVANDRWYEANIVKFGESGHASRTDAAEILARYPVGDEVNVFYDPEMPETAVLEPGVTFDSYLFLLIGLSILLLVVLVNGFPWLKPWIKKQRKGVDASGD
ncbi:MAG: DUF3592 domain-containing protein [Chloroflexota bacterium]